MFAGHLAAGLVLKKMERRLNLGWLFFAALFHDFLLGILVLSGLEQIHIPTDFAQTHYLTFTFPYSHGLVASIIWSALVFDAYVAAEHGDASGLALMSMAYDFVVPKSFVWGDFFAKAVVDMDFDRNYVADMRAPDSIIGSPISLLTWAPLSQAWTQDKLPSELNKVQPTDVETLLISGSIDFSTPADYARDELLPSLKNGRQVILSEVGHVSDVWNVQPKATLRLLTSFYATGIADDSLVAYAPMDFKIKFGFPILAKILFGTGVLLVVALVIGVKRLFHVRRGKHQANIPLSRIP